MNAPRHFVLPDLGEGLADAELVAWHVAVGDEVALNQVLVEVETEKAVVELPSPFAGTVVELLAAAGETVRVGAPLIAIAIATGDRNQRRNDHRTGGKTGRSRGEGADARRLRPVRGAPEPPAPQRQRAPGASRRGLATGGTASAATAGATPGCTAGALHGPPEWRRPGGRVRPRSRRDHHARGPCRASRRGGGARRRRVGPRDEGARAGRPEAHGGRHGPQRGDGAPSLRLPHGRRDADGGAGRSAAAQPALRRSACDAVGDRRPRRRPRPVRTPRAQLVVGRQVRRGGHEAVCQLGHRRGGPPRAGRAEHQGRAWISPCAG